jgi:carboxyl-terminal processing protease
MKALLSLLAVVVLALAPAWAADAPGPVIGIGTELKSISGHPVVVDVLPDSPAFKIGIKPGDRFLSIDDKSVDGMTLEQISHFLRGAARSHVKVTVSRDGKARDFGMRREILFLPGSQRQLAP